MSIDVGGRWTMNGAYAPRHRDANGNASCSAPIPIACSGNVTNPRASQRSPVAILFQRRGRTFLGQFTSFVEVSEDQSGQPSVCNPDAEDDTLAVGPLFGLGRASATAPFVTGIFEMPVSRLSRRRAFSVRVTPRPDREDSCDDVYDSCSQTNGLGMQLSFKPAR